MKIITPKRRWSNFKKKVFDNDLHIYLMILTILTIIYLGAL